MLVNKETFSMQYRGEIEWVETLEAFPIKVTEQHSQHFWLGVENVILSKLTVSKDLVFYSLERESLTELVKINRLKHDKEYYAKELFKLADQQEIGELEYIAVYTTEDEATRHLFKEYPILDVEAEAIKVLADYFED